MHARVVCVTITCMKQGIQTSTATTTRLLSDAALENLESRQLVMYERRQNFVRSWRQEMLYAPLGTDSVQF